MNDRRKYYYPLLVYGAMLLLVWVFSFFADVARLLSDSAGQATSLVSGEGIKLSPPAKICLSVMKDKLNI